MYFFKDLVEEASGGRIKVELYTSGVLGKEAEIIGSSDHLLSELPTLLEFARRGVLDLSAVVTKKIPLEAAPINAALERVESLSKGTARTLTETSAALDRANTRVEEMGDGITETRVVWHIRAQDVIAIGELFDTGRLPVERVIALTGPMVKKPRLISTRLGANTSDLIRDELIEGDVRVVAGSVLNGHRAVQWAAYLGRYDRQITVLQEGAPREFLSFMRIREWIDTHGQQHVAGLALAAGTGRAAGNRDAGTVELHQQGLAVDAGLEVQRLACQMPAHGRFGHVLDGPDARQPDRQLNE